MPDTNADLQVRSSQPMQIKAAMEKGDTSDWKMADVDLSEQQATGLNLLRMSKDQEEVDLHLEDNQSEPLFGTHARAVIRDLKEAWEETK